MNSDRKKKEFDINSLYQFVYMVDKISSLTKQLERERDERLRDSIRKKLKRERELAKQSYKKITKEINDLVQSGLVLNKEQNMNKLVKQFTEVSDRFMTVSKASIEKEKEIEMKIIEKIQQVEHYAHEWIDEDNESAAYGTGGSMRLKQKQEEEQKVVFVVTDLLENVVRTKEEIEREKLHDLQVLESDMNELHDAYKDLKSILIDQNEQLLIAEDNIIESNEFVKEGVEDIRSANHNIAGSRWMIFGIFLGIFAFVLIVAGLILFGIFNPFAKLKAALGN